MIICCLLWFWLSWAGAKPLWDPLELATLPADCKTSSLSEKDDICEPAEHERTDEAAEEEEQDEFSTSSAVFLLLLLPLFLTLMWENATSVVHYSRKPAVYIIPFAAKLQNITLGALIYQHIYRWKIWRGSAGKQHSILPEHNHWHG